MTIDLSGAHSPQRIIILRALQLGDSLCAVPAWRALRAAYPQAHITLIGLPWAQTFVRRFNHLLDDFLEFPGLPGFPERDPRVRDFPAFLARVQQQNYDLALQMQGSGYLSNTLTMLLGARRTAGFYQPGGYCPDPELFLRYPEGEPEAWRHLHLMKFLGLPLQGDHLEFPLSAEDWHSFEALPETQDLERDQYVVIHPGARAGDRRWPAERFAQVADALAVQGWQVVLTGTQEEAHLTQAVISSMRECAIDLTGRTTLGSLAALLSGARLLFSNDTGVSHVAAALKIPSLVLFTASDPQRWAPLDHQLHRAVSHAMKLPVRLVIEMALQQAHWSAGHREASQAFQLPYAQPRPAEASHAE